MPAIDIDTARGTKPSLINLRVLKACARFASKDDNRFYLQGVVVEIDAHGTTYVATDGRRIIAYRDDLGSGEKPNLLCDRFNIPVPQCKAFKLDKDDDGFAKIFQEHEGGRLTIAHGFIDIRFSPIEGPFVAWRRVLPQRMSGAIAQYDLPELADFAKFAADLEISQPFVAANGEAPAAVWFPGHPQAMGIIVPVKLTDELHRQPPDWARKGEYEDDQIDIEDVARDEAKDGKVAELKRA